MTQKLLLEKIISGGQTGTDVAGLDAALALGLQTGGWMTANYMTLDGPRTDYKEKYGISTVLSLKYAVRTATNVKNSDATVRFAYDWNSPGEQCTLTQIKFYDRTYHNVDLQRIAIYYPDDRGHEIFKFRQWLEIKGIKTLNVAGNAENKTPAGAPSVYEFVKAFLIEALMGPDA